MNPTSDTQVLVSEAVLRRIIREEVERLDRRRYGDSFSVSVPDRSHVRPSHFLSSLLQDISDVARLAGIKQGLTGRRSREGFARIWLLMNFAILCSAWIGMESALLLVLGGFVTPVLNVWCLIVYNSLEPDRAPKRPLAEWPE